MTTHMNVALSVPVLDVATTAAALAGVGIEEWITQAISEKAARQTDDDDFDFDDGGFVSATKVAKIA